MYNTISKGNEFDRLFPNIDLVGSIVGVKRKHVQGIDMLMLGKLQLKTNLQQTKNENRY